MKTDTASNWEKATNFTPKKGEIIVYSGNPPRIKVGDGTTKVNALPFATSSVYVGETEPTGDYDIWIDTSSDTGTGGVTAVIFTQDEKTKLAGIAANANNYSLPTAGSTLGGVKTTSTVSSTTGLTAVPIINGVPYYKDTNTTYTAGTGLTLSSTQFKHTNAVTAKTAYGSTETTASANGGSITVTDVKYDAQGHITGSTDRKITLSQTTYTLAGLGGVPTSRTVNGKALTSNISLTAGDVGAATANHTHAYLPLAGGDMTGYISWGNVANAGLEWTTDNGTTIHLRPYSPANVFQITMKPSGGTEFGALNIDTSGNINLLNALTIANGGTGATTVDAACANIGALRYKQYDNGYFETGAGNNSAWLQFYVSNEKKCQMDLFSDGKVGIGGKTVLVAGDVIGYTKYNTNNLAMDSWIDNNAYTLMLRDGGTDKCSLVMWPGGALTVNGSIVATEGRDNTFAGTLTVSNTKSAGGYVKIWEDNEGGNIAIASPNGKKFEIDAYNDTTLRCYAYDDGGNIKGMSFNRTNGDLSVDGDYYRAGQRVADVQHGTATVGTSGTTITFPHAFAGVPSVCANGSKQTSIRVEDITATGCKLVSGESNNNVQWIAVY